MDKKHFQYTVALDVLPKIRLAIERFDYIPKVEDDKKVDYRCGKQQRAGSMSFKAGDKIKALHGTRSKIITVWKKTGLVDANPAAIDDLVDILANINKEEEE